jgi:hypothetical protein
MAVRSHWDDNITMISEVDMGKEQGKRTRKLDEMVEYKQSDGAISNHT